MPHRNEGCKTPLFEGYWKIAVWNKAAGNGKGHEGIMVLVREKEGHFIPLEKKKTQIRNLSGLKYQKMEITSELQHVIFRCKFQC